MSDIKKTLQSYPDVSFIEDTTLEDLQNQMLEHFHKKYKDITGNDIVLGKADRNRLILYAAALLIYQGYQYIDNAGKQSLLKYSYSSFLENLGAAKGITRDLGSSASTMERFTVSETQKNVITIPMGTRVTAGDNIYFYTTEAAEIPAGEESIDVLVKCTEPGIKANEYEIGKISVLVDQIAYIGSVANVKKTDGGAEAESDEKLADRIYLAPSRYSTAGPEEAYIYWAKTCNSGISDVKVHSPTEGVVEIRFIMEDGGIPSEKVLQEVEQFLKDNKVRPLTDNVVVKAPDIIPYDIDLIYWVAESNKAQAAAIKANVEAAVKGYKSWQMEKIGRDVNPSNLMRLIMNAGAKRVDITSPVFTVLPEESIAISNVEQVIYGGVEDD